MIYTIYRKPTGFFVKFNKNGVTSSYFMLFDFAHVMIIATPRQIYNY